jgi:hypothetical protein
MILLWKTICTSGERDWERNGVRSCQACVLGREDVNARNVCASNLLKSCNFKLTLHRRRVQGMLLRCRVSVGFVSNLCVS